MTKDFDAYHKWLGIPPKDQPPHHYRLLALDSFESDPEVIDAAANRQMAYLQQRATGEHASLSQKILNEISAARLCLLDPKKKAAYDSKLRATLEATASKSDGAEPRDDTFDFLKATEAPEPSKVTPSQPKDKAQQSDTTRRQRPQKPRQASDGFDARTLRRIVGSVIAGGLGILAAVALSSRGCEKKAVDQVAITESPTAKPERKEPDKLAVKSPSKPSDSHEALPPLPLRTPETPDTPVSQPPDEKPVSSQPTELKSEQVGEVRQFSGLTGEAMSVAFSPDGRLAASGSKQELLLWDVSTGELKWRANTPSAAVEFSDNGQAIFCCGTRRMVTFDVATGAEKTSFDVEECQDWSTTFSKGGRYLATNKDRRIRIYDVQNPFAVESCKGATLAFTPTVDLLILDGHALSKYSIATRSTTLLCQIEQESRIDRMGVSPDNSMLVTGSFKSIGGPIGNLPGDNMVRIWDLQTGRELHALQDHKDWLLSVVFSPDGQRVLSAGGGTPDRYYQAAGKTPVLDTGIRLWDVKTGTLLHRFEGHSQPVHCVRFSPDGKYALSASKDKTVRLWRLPSPDGGQPSTDVLATGPKAENGSSTPEMPAIQPVVINTASGTATSAESKTLIPAPGFRRQSETDVFRVGRDGGVANPSDLPHTIHGTSHRDLRKSLRFSVNSLGVSSLEFSVDGSGRDGALACYIDNQFVERFLFPDQGNIRPAKEYVVQIPTGQHTVELRNDRKGHVSIRWYRFRGQFADPD